MIESRKPGVPWLFPAYPTFRETPYTFHNPEDFTCQPNRGGDTGSLFLLNHWIDTAPTPKPSNAAIVNAYPFLLGRAEECEKERGHIPNIVAVDFYRTGDVLRVVNHLNGVDQPAGERRQMTKLLAVSSLLCVWLPALLVWRRHFQFPRLPRRPQESRLRSYRTIKEE